MVVDVIVLSHKRPEWFRRCVEHLDMQEVEYHGVLVDDGHEGSTADFARSQGWTVVDPEHRIGYSEGVNLGFKEMKGSHALLLSNDAYMHDGALRHMLDHDEPIVGCLIRSSDGRVNHSAGTIHRSGWPMVLRFQEENVCGPYSWVTFAAVLIRKDVIDLVGPMDERYWFGHEDVDYCLMAGRAGFDIWFCADAEVTHDERGTREGLDEAPNAQHFHDKWIVPIPGVASSRRGS